MNVDEAKIVGMVSLGLGSLVAGMIPAWLSPRGRQSYPLLLSALLCFGGGVLLATALVHMLPEARETLPNDAELVLCAGFFMIYIVDELTHLLYGVDDNRSNESSSNSHSHSYGAVETAGLIGRTNEVSGHSCHVNHETPCTRSAAGKAGLLLALLLHSILEGLAIGLQSVVSKVILLLGAVASHKLVVGFCLGIELSAGGNTSMCSYIVAIVIFSLGSVIGIGAGMFVEDSSQLWSEATQGILQSLAAGTLLYVTVSEILPRERAKWHRSHRSAAILQLVATVTGFTLMFFINKYLAA